MIHHDILICWTAPDFGPFTIFSIAMAWIYLSDEPAVLPLGRAPPFRAPVPRLQGSGHERLTFGADHLLAVLWLPPTPLHKIFQVFGSFGLLEEFININQKNIRVPNFAMIAMAETWRYVYVYIYIYVYNRIVIIYIHCFSILPWLASTLLFFRWFEVLYSCYGW